MKPAAGWFVLLVLPFLWGCASDPAEVEYTPPERRPAKKVTQTGKVPQGIMAPVDQWKKDLAHSLPIQWQLHSIEPQVEAPPGWSRVEGNRGLLLTFQSDGQEQRFWVMPSNFSGRVLNPRELARRCAQNETFILYSPYADAPSWPNTGTAQVATVLGLN